MIILLSLSAYIDGPAIDNKFVKNNRVLDRSIIDNTNSIIILT